MTSIGGKHIPAAYPAGMFLSKKELLQDQALQQFFSALCQ